MLGGGGLCELLMYEPWVLDLAGCWEPGPLCNSPLWTSDILRMDGWIQRRLWDCTSWIQGKRAPLWKAPESALHRVVEEQKILWNIVAENRGFFWKLELKKEVDWGYEGPAVTEKPCFHFSWFIHVSFYIWLMLAMQVYSNGCSHSVAVLCPRKWNSQKAAAWVWERKETKLFWQLFGNPTLVGSLFLFPSTEGLLV